MTSSEDWDRARQEFFKSNNKIEVLENWKKHKDIYHYFKVNYLICHKQWEQWGKEDKEYIEELRKKRENNL